MLATTRELPLLADGVIILKHTFFVFYLALHQTWDKHFRFSTTWSLLPLFSWLYRPPPQSFNPSFGIYTYAFIYRGSCPTAALRALMSNYGLCWHSWQLTCLPLKWRMLVGLFLWLGAWACMVEIVHRAALLKISGRQMWLVTQMGVWSGLSAASVIVLYPPLPVLALSPCQGLINYNELLYYFYMYFCCISWRWPSIYAQGGIFYVIPTICRSIFSWWGVNV